MADIPAPPAGFTLDNSVPPPPAGFSVDKHVDPHPELSGWEKFTHGLSDPNHPNMWNVVRGLSGAYRNAATSGLMSEPVRAGMEALDFGGYNEKMRKLYPNASDQEIKAKVHDLYNQALVNARESTHQETQDNPYFGQKVTNFGASVLGSADPTWFVNPGSSLSKNFGTRLAVNAATHAGFNSAGDAAGQAMDIAEGVQKDFDVKRNLLNAGIGAAFGSAHTTLSAPIVSDFVSGLFKNRGVDTLPAAAPKGVTSPLTGQELKFSPEEQAQLKQVLRTGSVDDIKGFLAQKNGPKPSWQQVNQMVETRDALPEKFVNQDNVHEAFNSAINDLHHSVVSDHIAAQTQGWKNAPDIEVINHVNDIQDPAIKDQAINEGADKPDALGFVGQDGKVRIFANRMDSPETLNAVLYHESLGHYGLAQKFGDRLDTTIQTLLDRNVGKFKQDVLKWQKENPGAYGGDRIRAAEEVLAEMSQNGALKPSWSQALVSNMRQFGRQMGLKLGYSDGEVHHILAMAHDAVVNGKGRNVAANGFATRPSPHKSSDWAGLERPMDSSAWANRLKDPKSKFMFTGQKARSFHENHPTAFTPSDGIRRNEISDADARLKPEINAYPFGAERKLGEVLDHPKLFDQYPNLAKDVKVKHYDMGDRSGGYEPSDRTIHLNSRDPERLSTLLHEVQHAVQHEEGIIKPGEIGNDHLSDADYHADPREQEAFATEDRRMWTKVDRLMNGPPKFMTRNQLANGGDYAIQQMEHTYNAMVRDYVPETKTNAEVIRDAGALGFSPSQIKDLGKSQELAVRLQRMNAAAKALDIRMSETLKKLDTPDWSQRDADSLRQMIADHSYILAKLKGERAEIGRALQIAKLGYTKKQVESFGQLLTEQGGTLAPLGKDETLIRFARQLKQLQAANNLNGVNSVVSSLQRPNWEDYVTTLHQNMMLSGISTHVKAPLDMMIGIGRELMDTAGALPISLGREALRGIGINVKPGVHPTEVAARLWGVVRAAMDAGTYVNAAKTFVEGGHNPQGFGGKGNARIPIVSKVTDLISAQDAFFRAFATNMHLYGLGTRQALEEARLNGTPKDWDTIMTQGSNYALNPSTKLLEQAKDLANQTLLLNKNKLTTPLDRIKHVGPDASAGERAAAFVANFLTPFIRVEANSLMNRVIRRSPLAILDGQTRADLKAGGARADVAMTRIILGTASIAAYWAAAGQGKVTGSGPDNPSKKAQMMAGGWRPNSVHEDGQYNTGNKLPMSFNPFDVHNSTATMVANLKEAYDKGANKGQVGVGLKLALLSTFKQLSEMSWVNDISPAIDALTAPNATAQQKMSRFLSDEAGTMMPNLLGQTARVTDQNQPDTEVDDSILASMGNTMKAAVPGLRETLPVRYNVYGHPVQGGASFAGEHTWLPQDNRLTGGNHVDETTNPAEKELDRLNSTIEESLLTPVKKTIKVDGVKMKLTPEQVGEYQKLVGENVVATVQQEMGTEAWQQMSDAERVAEVKSIEQDIKKAAKEYLYGQH